ncbi:UDP-N-acetylmuramoyl-L-alanyl-D-glutamate--2,6-diaminopimelate ligase [Persephonella sp.]
MEGKSIKQLFRPEEILNEGKTDFITGLTNSSKNVKKGSVFFAVEGTRLDGHIFVEEAIQKGACAVVVSKKEVADRIKRLYPEKTVILVKNVRKRSAEVARAFFDFPDEKLNVIGITGTNGKTTTAHIIGQYLETAGYTTGIIGTLNYRVGKTVLAEGRTTPDPIQWFETLHRMKELGADWVVAEVSSHALDQYRVYGTAFRGAVFTNLSPEHLDYHRSMEGYFRAKERLFLWADSKTVCAVNTDDPYGRRLYHRFSRDRNVYSFGCENTPDLKIEKIKLHDRGTEFSFFYRKKMYLAKTKLLGRFNVYNTAGAVLLLSKLGFDMDFLVEKAVKLKPVRGRMEVVKGKDITAVVDYAHTPDALENVLKTLNSLKNGRIITVFGAGGDRDREKRPLMGKVAESLSDVVVITSDNPRTEDPVKIIQDILSGIKRKSSVVVEPDRKKAIETAVKMAEKGDIILIAGKGHETYQIIGSEKIPFDDRKIVEELITA